MRALFRPTKRGRPDIGRFNRAGRSIRDDCVVMAGQAGGPLVVRYGALLFWATAQNLSNRSGRAVSSDT